MYKDLRKEAMQKSKSHWEMDVSHSVFPRPRKNVQQDNWIAKEPPKWPHTHQSVDECDY